MSTTKNLVTYIKHEMITIIFLISILFCSILMGHNSLFLMNRSFSLNSIFSLFIFITIFFVRKNTKLDNQIFIIDIIFICTLLGLFYLEATVNLPTILGKEYELQFFEAIGKNQVLSYTYLVSLYSSWQLVLFTENKLTPYNASINVLIGFLIFSCLLIIDEFLPTSTIKYTVSTLVLFTILFFRFWFLITRLFSLKKRFNSIFTLKKFYFLLTVAFIITILTSNVSAQKILSFKGLFFDAGTFLFPVAYIVNSIITEVYGYKFAKISIIAGILANFLMPVLLNISIMTIVIITKHNYPYFSIYETVPRIIIASTAASLIGEITTSLFITNLKYIKLTSNTKLRIIIAISIGLILDSLIFTFISFYGTVSFSSLANVFITEYAIKLFVVLITIWPTELLINKLTSFFIEKEKNNKFAINDNQYTVL